MKLLEDLLDDEGFEKHETTLGGDGVGVLWPAVLRNGSEDEDGDEVDQEKFLNANGRSGVEKLVGVGVGAYEKRDGWKFWSNVGPHVDSEGKQEPIPG